MYPAPGSCPICQTELKVTHLHCDACDTTLQGHFQLNRFSHLSAEQLAFVELFVRVEGKLNRVGQELDLSYQAVRSKLTEVIESMGYAVGEPVITEISAEQRHEILELVSKGELSAEEAMTLLKRP